MVLFAFKGDLIVRYPFHIVLIVVPLFLQTNFIFLISYLVPQKLNMVYEDAVPAALIGAVPYGEGAIGRHSIGS